MNGESTKHTDADRASRESGCGERRQGKGTRREQPGEYATPASGHRLRADSFEQATTDGRIDCHGATRLAGNPLHVRIERI